MFLRKKKGQSMLEYAILMGVIIAVIVALQVYVRRAVQGKFKDSADSIGDQFSTREAYTVQTIQQSARKDQTLGFGTEPADGEAWSQSQIATVDESFVPEEAKVTEYKGYEKTTTDYVTAEKGSGAVGTHGTFASGVLSEKTLFDD